ncbi:MAG: FecR domain-containing protein [Planctomycetota bacterium]
MTIPDPIQQAIQAYYAERATDEQLAALEQWFRQDLANIRLFAEHGLLEWHMLCEHEKQDAAAILAILREAEENAEPDFSLLQPPSPEPPVGKPNDEPISLGELSSLVGYLLGRGLRTRVTLVTAIAATLIVAFILLMPSKETAPAPNELVETTEPATGQTSVPSWAVEPPSADQTPLDEPPRPEEPVLIATVLDGYQAQWDRQPVEGLYAGQSIQLNKGFAELSFTQGARVLVQAPAQIEAVSSTSIRIHKGRIFATTEHSDAIFEVHTPKLRLTDLGTAFGVLVDPETGQNASYVYSGLVQAVPVDGLGMPIGQAVMLREQQSVSIERGPDLQLGGLDRFSFVTDTEDARYTVLTQGQARYVGQLAINDQTSESLASDQRCHVLLERVGVSPSGPLEVAITDPGVYRDFIALEESIDLQAAVDSYLVRFNTASGELTSIKGRVTFPRPVVGIMVGTDHRMASDPQFALPDSDLGTHRGDGLEPYLDQHKTNQLNDKDTIRLSEDRLTIEFELAAKSIDQFRVLIQSGEDTPQP